MKKLFAVLVLVVSPLLFAAPAQAGAVNLGIIFEGSNWTGDAASFSAPTTCNDTFPVKEITYVGNIINDQAHSAKLFGGCHRARYFEDSNFGGASFVCDELCNSNDGNWSIGVSSIKYRQGP
jgi:hypothetical protein